MAANRGDGMAGSIARIWSRGGVFGCTYNLEFLSAQQTNPHSLPRPDPLGLD